MKKSFCTKNIFSTNEKYVPNTGEISFYRKKYVFPPVRNLLPLLEKVVFTD